jgi:hypothetical protein
MSDFDLIIVGAGPAGLALSQCVSHLNKRILIIESEKKIGGCHGVRRVNGLFTEHGPRIYSDTYVVFKNLLKEMNVNFYDIFTKYNFSIANIGGETVFSVLSWSELLMLAGEFIKLMLNDNHGINMMMQDYLYNNNFNKESIEIIDRICKLTDGGGIDKYTLNEFLQLLNQQFFYSLYQPKKPNDEGLFKIWRDYLESKGVTFALNTEINEINIKNNQIQSIRLNNSNQMTIVYGKNIVFAIPPKNLLDVVNKYNIPHNWGDLDTFAKETAYIDYISVSFHWDKKLDLPKIYGFPKSSWGVAFVVLSDYMPFEQETSQTVISAAITISDVKSNNNNKTANECNEIELIDEIILQLREAYSDLPQPTKAILSPGVKYDTSKKAWISEDTAFILTANKGFLPFQNGIIKNMYNLGTHNGKNYYKFTSMESTVSNSVVLSKILYPELNNSKYIKLTRSTSISDVFDLIVIVIILYLIYYSILKPSL